MAAWGLQARIGASGWSVGRGSRLWTRLHVWVSWDLAWVAPKSRELGEGQCGRLAVKVAAGKRLAGPVQPRKKSLWTHKDI